MHCSKNGVELSLQHSPLAENMQPLCDCFAPSVLILGFDEWASGSGLFFVGEMSMGQETPWVWMWPEPQVWVCFSPVTCSRYLLCSQIPQRYTSVRGRLEDGQESSLITSASSTKDLLVHLGRCLSIFLTKSYFACKGSVDHLSPAAVPSLHLPLFLPGEGSFVRKHCTKHVPAVSCTRSQLEQITPTSDRGEKLQINYSY